MPTIRINQQLKRVEIKEFEINKEEILERFPELGNGYIIGAWGNENDGFIHLQIRQWTLLKPKGKIVLYLPHKDLYKGCNIDHHQEFVPEDIEIIFAALGIKLIESEVDNNRKNPSLYSFLIVGEKQ